MALKNDAAVTISGPSTARAQVRKLLKGAGFEESDEENPTGLPDTTDGMKDPSVGFITVYCDDVDAVQERIESTGWVVRGHWQGIAVTHPLLVDTPEPDEAKLRAIVEQILKEKGH